VGAFDLLAINSKDLRRWSLEARQERLQALLSRSSCQEVLGSEAFTDGLVLLRVAEKYGLEGVVSKRRDAPYRSGACPGVAQVKTMAWRQANNERWRVFERA
jgi:bifunctional non-homologous end joining protein LigD